LGRRTGFRTYQNLPTPPANGGFLVVRGIFALIALILPLVMVLGPMAPGQRAVAQNSPQAKSSDQDTLVREIVSLDSEVKALNSKLATLEGKSSSLRARISSLNDEIAAKRKRLAAKRKALAQRVRSMYVNGKSSTLTMLLTSDGVSEFIQRNEYVEKVHKQDSELVVTVKNEAGSLEASASELSKKAAEVSSLASELRTRKDRLVKSKAEKEQLLAQAGAKAAAVQAQSTRVETKMVQMNPTVVTGNRTGRVLVMVATGYSPQEPGLTDSTATGLRAQHGVVAVDPRVIPLGTRVYVEGYGNAIAGDTGSAIKGNRIDLCFDTLAECNAYGKRTVKVEILD